MINRGRLLRAAELLVEAATQLDTAELPRCDGCGMTHKRNVEEYRICVQVRAMIEKLRRFAAAGK
jgi:hypothetical protein